MQDTRRTNTFIAVMAFTAAMTAGYSIYASHSVHVSLALAILGLSAATSRMRVKLPGVDGNMSVNLPFLLMAVLTLSTLEAALVAAASTAVQCWPRKGNSANFRQITFNLSMMICSTSLASVLLRASWWSTFHASSGSLPLTLATLTLFLGQTVPVAAIVAISEHKASSTLWWNIAHLSFPYYVVSAGIASMLQAMSSHLGWGLALAAFPVMFGIYHSYRVYFGRMAETLQSQPAVRAAAASA